MFQHCFFLIAPPSLCPKDSEYLSLQRVHPLLTQQQNSSQTKQPSRSNDSFSRCQVHQIKKPHDNRCITIARCWRAVHACQLSGIPNVFPELCPTRACPRFQTPHVVSSAYAWPPEPLHIGDSGRRCLLASSQPEVANSDVIWEFRSHDLCRQKPPQIPRSQLLQ